MTDYRRFKASRQLPDWRDAAAYSGLLGAGRSALAWELLRRDPSYHGLAHQVPGRVRRGREILPLADPQVVARRGLLFR